MHSFLGLIGRNFDSTRTGDDAPYELYLGELSESAIFYNSIDMADIINEVMSTGLGVTELIFENMVDGDFDTIQYLSESILGTVINGAVNLLKKALGFIKGLFDKINAFTDQFEKSSATWLNKYRTRVLEKEKTNKDYTYDGYQWNTKYFEANAYPEFDPQYTETARELKALADDYNKMGRSVKGSGELNLKELDRMAANLEKRITQITKAKSFTDDSMVKELETQLGCKTSEITSHYMGKARSNEKLNISGFKNVSATGMLDAIEKSTDRLNLINENIKRSSEELGKAYDIIKDLVIEDYADKDKLNTKAEETNKTDKEKENAGEAGKLYSEAKGRRESMTSLTSYSKTLSDSVNALLNMWRKYTDANNMLSYVQLAVVRDSTQEFIAVLTKFANKKG